MVWKQFPSIDQSLAHHNLMGGKYKLIYDIYWSKCNTEWQDGRGINLSYYALTWIVQIYANRKNIIA